jgi:hypothetical protein
MDERTSDVAHARRAMTLTGGGEDDDLHCDKASSEEFDEVDDFDYDVWGSLHPDGGKENLKRARWTDEEVNYIGEKIAKLEKTSPHRLIARCLAIIKADPDAKAIFHENHVLDSGRLRSGYDAYQKLDASLLF